jgi:hypothetical protein
MIIGFVASVLCILNPIEINILCLIFTPIIHFKFNLNWISIYCVLWAHESVCCRTWVIAKKGTGTTDCLDF